MTDEVLLQGDMEWASGMDVSSMCDRTSQSRVAVQKGMIDHIVAPFCEALAGVLPSLKETFAKVAEGLIYQYW